MPPRIPTASEVAELQAHTIRSALYAAPGSAFQLRLLTAAAHIGNSITPQGQQPLTPGQKRALTKMADELRNWIDIHFGDGPFAGAILALTNGLQDEAA